MEEQLIEAVRAFPVLYDTSHPDYFRAKLKQDLWESIAKDLNLHNGELTKSIWERLRNNHRDALRRQRNSIKSGTSAAAILKKWKYQQQMAFLLDHMNNRPRETNMEDAANYVDSPQIQHSENQNDDDVLLPNPDNNDDIMMTSNETEDSEASELETPSYYDSITKRDNKKSKKQDLTMLLKKSILNREQRAKERANERKKVEENSPKDELYYFYMSMYEQTKNMPPAMQHSVKANVFQIVSQTQAQLLNIQHAPISTHYQPQNLTTTVNLSQNNINEPETSNLVKYINNFVP